MGGAHLGAKSAACNHPWPMDKQQDKRQDKQARGEAFDWRHTQTRVCRFGLLLHQLAVSSFHLAPPNDPDGPPFSPFSEEGPKERVSGVIDADDDGGAPYLHGRPSPPPKWISSQHSESRVETCATHPRERLLKTPRGKAKQQAFGPTRTGCLELPRQKQKVHCSSSETLTGQDSGRTFRGSSWPHHHPSQACRWRGSVHGPVVVWTLDASAL